MNNNLLRLCFIGAIATSGFIVSPSATADPPGMMRQHMMDEESRQRWWDDDEMMRGYGRIGSSWGHGMMQGPMMMDGPMMGRMMGGFSDLDLSKEQRSKIRSIMQESRKSHLALMSKMLDASDKLSDLYDSDTPDPEKIGKAYDEVFSIQKQMIQEGIRAHNKAFELLSKEQREQYRKRAVPHRFGMMYE